MAHAYYVTGEVEQGIETATKFADDSLGIRTGSPDLVVLRHGLFSVDDARKLADIAYAAAIGNDGKAIIVSVTRFFHEAQNALLKIFEEPPQGVTLILSLPTAGLLLPTLRSRLLPLPGTAKDGETPLSALAREFISAGEGEREKLMAKLLDRTKSDKDEDKQRARNDAVMLLEGVARVAESRYRAAKGESERRELRSLLDDLTHFLPLLHTRSAPLKLIFEHLLLVIPSSLVNATV